MFKYLKKLFFVEEEKATRKPDQAESKQSKPWKKWPNKNDMWKSLPRTVEGSIDMTEAQVEAMRFYLVNPIMGDYEAKKLEKPAQTRLAEHIRCEVPIPPSLFDMLKDYVEWALTTDPEPGPARSLRNILARIEQARRDGVQKPAIRWEKKRAPDRLNALTDEELKAASAVSRERRRGLDLPALPKDAIELTEAQRWDVGAIVDDMFGREAEVEKTDPSLVRLADYIHKFDAVPPELFPRLKGWLEEHGDGRAAKNLLAKVKKAMGDGENPT